LKGTIIFGIGLSVGNGIGKYEITKDIERKMEENRNKEYYEIYLHCDQIGKDDTLQIGRLVNVEYDELGRMTSGTCAGTELIPPRRSDPMYNLATANMYTSKRFPINLYLKQNRR